MPNSPETIRMNVTFTKDLHKWLKQESIKTGLSMSTIVSTATQQYRQQMQTPIAAEEESHILQKVNRIEELVHQLANQKPE